MRKFSALKFLLVITAVQLCISCERRPLEEEYNTTALIPVSIDWSLSGLDPDNDPDQNVKGASVWFFPQAGSAYAGTPIECKLNNPRGETIEVPVGIYAVLVFNNTVNEFSRERVGFRGTDKYDTFEYYAKPDARNKTAWPAAGEILPVCEPDILAAWHLDRFEVTADMVTRTHAAGSKSAGEVAGDGTQPLRGIKPLRLTRTVTPLVHVDALNNAVSAEGRLSGLGSSVLLSTGRVPAAASSMTFVLNNRKWDDQTQKTNGTIEARFESFGPIADAASGYTFYTSFTLRSAHEGSTTYPTPPAPPFTYDVSSQVTSAGNALKISIEIGMGTPTDPKITLPEVSSGGEGGFDVGVGDWGPDVVIPL